MWEVPPPSSTLDVRVGDDTVITLRRHGNPDGPRLVLSHGNGLAIDLYYPFWSLLIGEFDLIVYDLRNHGRNPLGPLGGHHLPALILDQDLVLAAIDAHFGRKPKIGVFHSASGLATLLAPSNGSEMSAVILFDPPLRKPGLTHNEYDAESLRIAATARQRTDRFATKEQFTNLVLFSPNFRRVVPGVVELLAETTLRQNPSQDGYQLCCPPEYEAQLMEYGRIFTVAVDLMRYGCPIKVIGADPTLPYSFLPTIDMSEMAGVNYDFLPDATHMMQLEQPANCVDMMLAFLRGRGVV